MVSSFCDEYYYLCLFLFIYSFIHKIIIIIIFKILFVIFVICIIFVKCLFEMAAMAVARQSKRKIKGRDRRHKMQQAERRRENEGKDEMKWDPRLRNAISMTMNDQPTMKTKNNLALMVCVSFHVCCVCAKAQCGFK